MITRIVLQFRFDSYVILSIDPIDSGRFRYDFNIELQTFHSSILYTRFGIQINIECHLWETQLHDILLLRIIITSYRAREKNSLKSDDAAKIAMVNLPYFISLPDSSCYQCCEILL